MAVKISHNGKYFALGSSSGELWLFSLPKYEFMGKSQGHSRYINNLQWSLDDKQIVSSSIHNSINLILISSLLNFLKSTSVKVLIFLF